MSLRGAFFSLLILLWLVVALDSLHAQPTAGEEGLKAVSFQGIASLSTEQLREMAGITHPGAVAGEELTAAIQRLQQRGIFSDVRLVVEGQQAVIQLSPRSQILTIVVSGVETLKAADVRRVARLRAGTYLDEIEREKVIVRVRDKYREHGFNSAHVSLEFEESSSEFWVTARLIVKEGYQSKIAETILEATLPQELADIPQRLRQDAIGRPATKENIRQLRQNILLAMRREGYLQATVSAAALEPSKDSADVELRFSVIANQPLTLIFTGNTVFEPRQLLGPLRMETRTVPFTPGAISSLARDIRQLYQERGYFAATVNWEELPPQGDRKIFKFSIEEGRRYHCKRVIFRGNQVFSASHLRSFIQTRAAGWYVFRRWSPGIVLSTQLEIDREKLLEVYADAGFLDAKVIYEVTIPESSSALEVVFTVEEGPQRVVEDIELVWSAPGSSTSVSSVSELLLIQSALVEGEPFSRSRLREEQRRLYERVRALGFPNVAVELEGNAGTGTVRYYIAPGPRVFIGDVDLRGLVFSKDFIIERELAFASEEPWDQEKIRKSQQHLAELGLFRDVQITPADGVLDEEVEDIEVRIKERPTGSAALGAAFTTEDGLRLFGELGQRNFLGRGHNVRLASDGFFKAGSSVLDAGRVRIGYAIPQIFGPNIDLLSELFLQSNTQLVDEYSFDRFGGWVSFHRRYGEHLRVVSGISVYKDALYDVDPGIVIDPRDTSSTFYVYPGIGLDFDYRDSRLSPASGYRSFFDFRVASESVVSEVSILYGLWQQSFLQKLSSRVIWANRLQLEALEPFGTTDVVPLSQRLFLGGQNSLRGFSKNAIGPRATSGIVVGGDRAVSASTELRYAFNETFTGVVFLDLGQAFLVHEGSFDGDTNDLDHLRFSPGFGGHYTTPIGPIRAEVGIALDREFGERWGRINFSIGTGY